MLRPLLGICLLAVLSGCTEGYWRARKCERSGPMRIDCSPWFIYIISASYGRSLSHVCGGDGNNNCHAGSSMRVVEHECEGQQRCTVHVTNSAFGDPCVGTHKYLEVYYKCKHNYNRGILKRICERSSGESIHCPYGKTIDILSANYGRTAGNHVCTDTAHDTNCRASGSLSIVRGKCQGRSYCYLEASNSVYGDPCQGTRKYLEIRYKCE